jgi:hypothetical protein
MPAIDARPPHDASPSKELGRVLHRSPNGFAELPGCKRPFVAATSNRSLKNFPMSVDIVQDAWIDPNVLLFHLGQKDSYRCLSMDS